MDAGHELDVYRFMHKPRMSAPKTGNLPPGYYIGSDGMVYRADPAVISAVERHITRERLSALEK